MKIDFIEKFFGLFHLLSISLSLPFFVAVFHWVYVLPLCMRFVSRNWHFLSGMLSMCPDAKHNKWSDFVPHRDLNFAAHKIVYIG